MKQTLLYTIFFLLPFTVHSQQKENYVLLPFEALEEQNRTALLKDLALIEISILSIEQAQFVNDYFDLDKSQIAWSIPFTLVRNSAIGAMGYSLDRAITRATQDHLPWFAEFDKLEREFVRAESNLTGITRALGRMGMVDPHFNEHRQQLLAARKRDYSHALEARNNKLLTQPARMVRVARQMRRGLRLATHGVMMVGGVALLAATYEEVVVLYMGREAVNEKLISLREDRDRLRSVLYPEESKIQE